jgi:hypothetical protein
MGVVDMVVYPYSLGYHPISQMRGRRVEPDRPLNR